MKLFNSDDKKEKITKLEDEIKILKRKNDVYEVMRRNEVEFIDKLKHKLVLANVKCLELEEEITNLKQELDGIHVKVGQMILDQQQQKNHSDRSDQIAQ